MNKRKITRTAISIMLASVVAFGTVGFAPIVTANETTITVTSQQTEIARLTAELNQARAERNAAKAELTKKTAAYNKLKKSYNKLKKSYNKLEKSYYKMQAKANFWHWKYLSKKKQWSQSDLRWAVKYDAKKHGLSKAEQKKLANAAVDIVFIGAHESGGRTDCVSGQYVGMFQFGKPWGSIKERKSGTWSVRRFVKVYRDGGMRSLHQHWAATLGK